MNRYREPVVRSFALPLFALLLVLGCGQAMWQGQDSTPYERDAQVIAQMLPGVYDNWNQSYFDGRVGVAAEERHPRLHTEIAAVDGTGAFVARHYWGFERHTPASVFVLRVSAANDLRAASMRVWAIGGDQATLGDERLVRDSQRLAAACTVLWRREAAQFHGKATGACADVPATWVLSQRQLWMFPLTPPDEIAPVVAFKLHRARAFECYADMPGVGGGRAADFKRYDGFQIHDQGGSVWFQATDGREFGITLSRVDWPVNNFIGEFARDALVIYFSERTKDGVKSHGYAHTNPDTDRIGVNLHWVRAYCYVPHEQTPFM